MTPSPPARATRSLDEIRAAIDAFTDVEWARVRRAAEYWARAQRVEVDDLMQDALERALDGSRQCPLHISVPAFLSGAMRSISSNERKARAGRAEVHLVTEDGRLVIDPPDDRQTPAEAAESWQETARIKQTLLDLFEGDLAAQTILEGDMDGMEGEELRGLTDLDVKGFASKRRFIRRRIDKAFPKGWTS
jgi:DNA-directed RNA polymerase specialized sigma24 family protein